MAKLVWDKIGERKYETGTDRGVLLVTGSDAAVAWSGLQKVTESPEGGEETALYADNIKYLSLYSAESLKGTIEAYTYPDEFEACDGSLEIVPGVTIGQQDRVSFRLAYRTYVGNDTEGNAHGYKLHIIYGMKASPSERSYGTINDSPEAVTFSWAFSSTPVAIGDRFSASIVINSLTAPKEELAKLEEVLFGTAAKEATIPDAEDVIAMMTVAGGANNEL